MVEVKPRKFWEAGLDKKERERTGSDWFWTKGDGLGGRSCEGGELDEEISGGWSINIWSRPGTGGTKGPKGIGLGIKESGSLKA
ncbi:hypothetical protein Bca52824_039128 [Brassica carinata]|uniref:Uncharacterized protein n=1 Tax=Brassica carinata TaxID=52824 RepID=A0A8X7RNR1_BRACI|nr:hypothetical protein Bca52824_039128 [Brassica carinata]